MTTASRKSPSTPRDDVFWLAVRATYAAGVPADRTAEIFGISRSALRQRARQEGWLRRDLAREAEDTLTAELTAEIPGVEDTLRAARSPAALAEIAPDAASIVPKALAAADAAIMRAIEAAAGADAAGAEAASKLGERLARMANVLGRTKTPQRPPIPSGDGEAQRNALLARIDKALSGDREARRIEVEELRTRGIDPREAWVWDAEEGDWVWDPGGAMAKAAAAIARPADDDADSIRPGHETQD